MSQQGPNPIEIYQAAVEKMLPIISGVKADQLSAPTPCSEWNVQGLLNHNIKVAEFTHALITGGATDMAGMFAVGGPLPSEGAASAFQAATSNVLNAIKTPGTADKIVETPFGAMPAGQFLMIPFGDILIHQWDLAKGTNQDTSMDSSMAEACYGVLSHGIEQAREGGFFGSDVQVSMTGSIQDKLLGLSGRQP